MMVTYSDLIQIGVLVVGIIGLFFSGKQKGVNRRKLKYPKKLDKLFLSF